MAHFARLSLSLSFPLVAHAACTSDTPNVATTTQAMEGRVFKAELALDAPWRLEPEQTMVFCDDPKGCGDEPTYRFDKVPIVISIRDTDREWSPFEIFDVDIVELGTPYSQHFELEDFHEVEWTRDHWPWPLPSEDFELLAENHRICRLWQGDQCPEALTVLPEVSEWDALLFYPIQQTKHRGGDVRLQIRLNYKKREIGPDPDDSTNAEVRYIDDVFENDVVVHLGDAPLPRFDDRWAYGDLHYHSQGTDNEGESGYGYRATLHAISAVGLDFVLATEHASDSGQFSRIATLPNAFDTLRDMSAGRFRTLRRRINDPDGANAQILSFPRLRNPWRFSVPQLFLGGEVDVYPEVSAAEASSGELAFGSTGRYTLDTCDVVTPGFACDGLHELLTPKCTHPGALVWPLTCSDNAELRFAVSDLQGVEVDDITEVGIERSRQHMVYFPADPTREDAFIASHTSTWGGGSRSLEDILRVELGEQRKGAVFLAHPVDRELTPQGTEKRGIMRLGPDIMPYSEAQLRDAFASPDVLGLEAWNEDGRLRTTKPKDAIIGSADGLTPFVEGTLHWEVQPERPLVFSLLHHGIAMWDQLLRWGLDPVRTQALPWLDKGHVRRVFFAAGSDAHGDLNYRRAGYMFGIDAVNDTAIGKPRNLVFVGASQGTPLQGSKDAAPSPDAVTSAPLTQSQVLDSLRAGQFVATDGPIVRVAIDANRNGVIDDADVPMGGEGEYMRGGDLALVVEWKSTPEFGAINRIELAVGGHSDALGVGMTYVPSEHAVRTYDDPQGVPAKSFTEAGTGATHTRLDDNYWLDPTGMLRFTPWFGEGFAGRRSIVLRPGDFPIGIAVDGDQGPRFVDPRAPDRIYVRAFVATKIEKTRVTTEVCEVSHYCQLHPDDDACVAEPTDCKTVETEVCYRLQGCVPRLAFSNPVWADAQRAAADPGDVPPSEVK
ncbi:MAG TPA: hypothetical protein VIV40_25145 [Kofleriaceae bacterium]